MLSYAPLSDLVTPLGRTAAQLADDERAAIALYAGSRYCDDRLGVEWEPLEEVDALEVAAADPMVRAATVVAAVRFYKAADVPWGVAGGMGDMPVYVRRGIPEADQLLRGLMPTGGVTIG